MLGMGKVRGFAKSFQEQSRQRDAGYTSTIFRCGMRKHEIDLDSAVLPQIHVHLRLAPVGRQWKALLMHYTGSVPRPFDRTIGAPPSNYGVRLKALRHARAARVTVLEVL